MREVEFREVTEARAVQDGEVHEVASVGVAVLDVRAARADQVMQTARGAFAGGEQQRRASRVVLRLHVRVLLQIQLYGMLVVIK